MLSNMTTIRTLDRSLARGLGTIVGAIVLSGILAFNINSCRYIDYEYFSTHDGSICGIELCICCYLHYNPSHYVKWLSISKQVSKLLTRIIDVLVGIIIAVLGILFLARRTASSMLPSAIAELVRKESILFHYLFSENKQRKQRPR